MKSTKSLRSNGRFESDDLRRGTKLAPVKKSGKEHYSIYVVNDDEDDIPLPTTKKESVFDYFDDEQDDL